MKKRLPIESNALKREGLTEYTVTDDVIAAEVNNNGRLNNKLWFHNIYVNKTHTR